MPPIQNEEQNRLVDALIPSDFSMLEEAYGSFNLTLHKFCTQDHAGDMTKHGSFLPPAELFMSDPANSAYLSQQWSAAFNTCLWSVLGVAPPVGRLYKICIYRGV